MLILSLIAIVVGCCGTALALFATNKAEKNLSERHVLTRHGRFALAVVALSLIMQSAISVGNKWKEEANEKKELDKESSAREKEKKLTAENDQFKKEVFSLHGELSDSQKLASGQRKEIEALNGAISDTDKANAKLHILLDDAALAFSHMKQAFEVLQSEAVGLHKQIAELQKQMIAEVVSTDKFGSRVDGTLFVKAELEHELVVNWDSLGKEGTNQGYCVMTGSFKLADGTKTVSVRFVNVKAEDCKLLKFEISARFMRKLWPKSPECSSGDANIKIDMDKIEETYIAIPFSQLQVAKRIIQQNPGAGFAIVESK